MSQPTPSPDPRLAQALAAAERRLAMLERLAEMGMALAGEISTRAVEFPQRPGVGHEPARAFASVSRAVRLTLVLAARVEKHILAMRKGGIVAEPEMASDEPKGSLRERRERVRSAVSVAIEREAADAQDAEGLLRRLDERLTERDDFGPLLSRPFRACVEAVCEDLGLDAEAVLGEEDEDFAPFAPHPLEEAGEGDREAVEGAARDGTVVSSRRRTLFERPLAWPPPPPLRGPPPP